LFFQRFVASEQFAVDLRELFQCVIELVEVINAVAGALLLFRTLEQKLLDMSGGQALGEVKEGTVLFSLMTAAVRLSALAVAFDKGSAQEVRMDGDLAEQSGLALAQSQSGAASGGMYPSHIYGQDMESDARGKKKESTLPTAVFANLPKWLQRWISAMPG
jgi:hypothetical protein